MNQNETMSSSQSNSALFCIPESLGSDNSIVSLAADAQNPWWSASLTREPLSNYSSTCSSASTVASSTACLYLTLPAAPSFGLAPSFDFARHGKRRHSVFENSVGIDLDALMDAHQRRQRTHHPAFENPTFRYGSGISLAASMDSHQLSRLSVGSGFTSDEEGRWQERCAVEMQELEEYSLGPGTPC